MSVVSLDRPAEHLAALYESDDFVVGRVASFVAEGLTLGEHVLVLSTIAHWNAIANRLERGAVDYGRAVRDRRLVLVDAEAIVDAITENGTVRAERFAQVVQPLLNSAVKTRLYGEVVSLLAEQGQIDAAIAIERTGHELSQTRGMAILCGYRLTGRRGLSTREIERVRDVHDRCVVEGQREAISGDRAREDGRLHAVRFYHDRQSLARIVGRFLGEGFVASSPALVIATPEHREAIADALSAQFFDVARLESAGELVMVDADALLAEFMVNGMPDAVRFTTAVVPLLEKACHGRAACVIRAYGEMVDVLWQAGQTVAAVRLETLWNQLAQSHAFALLCGYSMGHFYKDAAQQEIGRLHTHVSSDTGDSVTLR